MKKITILIVTLLLFATGCRNEQPVNNVLTPQDAEGGVIGVLSGSSSFRFADGIGDVRVYTKSDELTSALKSGTLDCIFMESEPAEAIVSQMSGIKILEETYSELKLSFAAAKENADLTRDIDNALTKLEEEGVLKGFRDKHILGKKYTYNPPETEKREVTLRLAAPDGFPPYSYKNESGELNGLDIDTAQAVCDLLGVELSVEEVKHSELTTVVQFGKVDFAVGFLYANDADMEKVDFTNSYTTQTQVIIVRK